MANYSSLIDAPAVRKYAGQMKREVGQIIELTQSLPRSFDVGDPHLRRSLHLEASALACYWIKSFSEASPEMLMWAEFFSKKLMMESEAAITFREIGYPAQETLFFANRDEYYRANRATWRLDEHILTCWVGIINACALLRDMKSPPLLGHDQKAEYLLNQKGRDLEALKSILGINTNSQEYLDLMGAWLKDFTESLAKIVTGSNASYLAAIIEAKQSDKSAVATARAYKTICLVIAGWCFILPFLYFDQIWVYQLTRIAVTIAAVWLALILRSWQKISAMVIAILFNPLLPIDFDKDAWMVVDLSAAAFLAICAFWPCPYLPNEEAQQAGAYDGDQPAN